MPNFNIKCHLSISSLCILHMYPTIVSLSSRNDLYIIRCYFIYSICALVCNRKLKSDQYAHQYISLPIYPLSIQTSSKLKEWRILLCTSVKILKVHCQVKKKKDWEHTVKIVLLSKNTTYNLLVLSKIIFFFKQYRKTNQCLWHNYIVGECVWIGLGEG